MKEQEEKETKYDNFNFDVNLPPKVRKWMILGSGTLAVGMTLIFAIVNGIKYGITGDILGSCALMLGLWLLPFLFTRFSGWYRFNLFYIFFKNTWSEKVHKGIALFFRCLLYVCYFAFLIWLLIWDPWASSAVLVPIKVF